MLKVGIIGLGDVSIVHLPAIHQSKQGKLVAVCDENETFASEYEQDQSANFYSNYEKMFDQEDLDVVHVCLPHHLHLPATEAAVKRGIHVFLEKPLSRNVADAERIVALDQAHPDIKVCVSLQNRYNETVEKLKEIADSNKYGKVTGIKGLVTWNRPKSYYRDKPWRGKMQEAGGGVIINQSIHTLDLVQLFGGEIKSIRGSVDNLLDYPIEVEDTATARFEFENGASGLFFATIANSGNSSVEFQVVFEHAKYTIKDSFLYKQTPAGKEVVLEDETLPGTKFYYGASHAKLIEHFYDCIINDSNDFIHTTDALKTMEIIDAIYQSSAEQKTIQF